MMDIKLLVNKKPYTLNVDPSERLLDVLRNRLGLIGTKEGCGEGECGACTVIIDGKTVNSCLVLVAQADGCEIITIEGVGNRRSLHPVQKAFVEVGAVQCGFCTPGMVLAAKALLDKNAHPSDDEIGIAMSWLIGTNLSFNEIGYQRTYGNSSWSHHFCDHGLYFVR